MVTLVKESLEKRVFVDKAETVLLVDNSTLEVTAREYRKLLSVVKSGKLRDNEDGITLSASLGGGFVMQSGSGGKIVLGEAFSRRAGPCFARAHTGSKKQ
jgi:hypothetical protein